MRRVKWAGYGMGIVMAAAAAILAMKAADSAAVPSEVRQGDADVISMRVPKLSTLPALPVLGAERPRERCAAGPEEAMRRDLAERVGVPPGNVTVVTNEEVTWADGCLGVHRAGVACSQALTPGFMATLAVEGLPWLFQYHGAGDWFMAASFVAEAALSAPFE